MKTCLSFFSILFFFLVLTACSKDDDLPAGEVASGASDYSGSFASGESGSGGSSGGSSGGGSDPEPDPELDGLLTAAEWHDLSNWDFWLNLIADTTYTDAMMAWGIDPAFYPGAAPSANAVGRQYQIAFIVDATSSMSDELEYLKEDMEAVIEEVEITHPSFQIETGAVFYRDEGDDYVTRYSNFSTNVQLTRSYINAQSAAGGGNWPEAVHSALDVGLNELNWSGTAGSKLAFLVLDAPPHNVPEVMGTYRRLIAEYAQSGIRIVPVVASGIDKSTEFLMRMTAIRTHGTYVFITDDSGIGEAHLVPTVGEYEVEFLSDLLVRLIGHFGSM